MGYNGLTVIKKVAKKHYIYRTDGWDQTVEEKVISKYNKSVSENR